MKRLVLTFAAAVNLMVLDQFAKAVALAYLKPGVPESVVPGFVDFTLVKNFGCAWGMFQGQVWPLAAFGIFALCAIVWFRRSFFPQNKWGAVCETLLYAGLLGNLFDRIFRGGVIDMIDCHWGPHHFPVFNVADAYITIAAAILVASALFQKDAEEKCAPSTC